MTLDDAALDAIEARHPDEPGINPYVRPLVAALRAEREYAQGLGVEAVTLAEERDAAIARAEAAEALIRDGVEAFRLTKEYVNVPDENGFVLLPDAEGWSHFDWCERARRALDTGATT